jgi:hypothetical protein
MAYLTRTDLENSLNEQDVTKLAPTDELVATFSRKAIAEVKASIQHRYDPDLIFIDVITTFSLLTTYAVGDLLLYTESAYVAATTYAVDDRVSYDGKIYKSLQAGNTGNQPDTSPTFWEYVVDDKLYFTCIVESLGFYPENTTYFTQDDNREQSILDITTIIAIYKLFRKIQPRNIPEWVSIEYDNAQSMLKEYARGTKTVILPVQVDADGEQEGHRISYGVSETQKDWEY